MRSLVVACAFALLVGCASVPATPPATHPVSFTSEPAGALVDVDGQRCTTPCTMELGAGEHPASVGLDAQQSQALTISAASDDRGLRAGFRDVVGNALQTTGTTLNAIGEAGMYTFRGATVNMRGEDVFIVTVGAISIGSILVGRVLISVGGVVLTLPPDRPPIVHVKFVPDDETSSTAPPPRGP